MSSSPDRVFPDGHRGLRILHVVENLGDQAVENWLLRILGESRKTHPRHHWTFYSTLRIPGKRDADARDLGADVLHTPSDLSDTSRFIAALHRTMKIGRFDVLHAHHDVMSALYLAASMGTGIRKRIVHIHNTSLSIPAAPAIKRAILREPMRQICLHRANMLVGISRDALQSMLGSRAPRPGKDVVVYYGIDTSRFCDGAGRRAGVREAIGIEPEQRIMLFAGRMNAYKNPVFLVDMLACLAESMPHVRAVFAGVGEDEATVAVRARRLGVEDRVRILGWRRDLPDLMAASDLLVWPGQEEPKEGLGLGIVEAQAAGLPIIMSRSVPDDAIVIPELVSVLPLAAGAEAWADEARRKLVSPQIPREEALRLVEASPFSLAAGTRNIIDLYPSD